VISTISPIRVLIALRSVASRPPGTTPRLALATALFLVLLAAGLTTIVGSGGGLYWLPAAFTLAILMAAVNAWVLLVEVLR
jgi:hypothetical protein